MQRDCEFEVHDVDKSGGFIGALYLNKTENAAVSLVREGLATVHSYSADGLPWSKQLYDTEVISLSGPVLLFSYDFIGRGQEVQTQS